MNFLEGQKRESFSFLDSFKRINDERVLREFDRFCETLSSDEQEIFLKVLINRMQTSKPLENIKEIFDSITGNRSDMIPVSIFSGELSPFESIVLFLKENKELRLNEIAKKLHKSESSAWLTYRNAKKKNLNLKIDYSLLIPLSKFDDSKSILEIVVLFLIESCSMKVKDVSSFLNKSVSTIWTTYNRVRTK